MKHHTRSLHHVCRRLLTVSALMTGGMVYTLPGLTIAKNEGFRRVVVIRGAGLEANQNDIANPSVSFHVDGVYTASDISLNTDFLDVERIEVLRGPQGTVFGQNSTGGAINLITKQPSLDDFEGQVDLTLEDDTAVNSRFTDVFGVGSTSEEFVPPRQFLIRGSVRF